MAFSPVVAVYDACVLYPFHLRNVIVQAAVDRLVHARWTDEIHDEWMRNLVANAPDLSVERLNTTKQLMTIARRTPQFRDMRSTLRPSACPIPVTAMWWQRRSRPKPRIS